MITFENVSVDIDGKRILSNLNLSVSDGITTIIGQSGFGKTTLLRLIAGLIMPTEGVVHSDYRKPAFVFQEQRLFNWYTALKNVVVVNEQARESDAVNLLTALGLNTEDIAKYPNRLSGGMRQRVCLARALFYGGDILLLDEPFNGLDGENREKAVSLITQTSKKIPVVIVSHIAEDASLADRVINLEKL